MRLYWVSLVTLCGGFVTFSLFTCQPRFALKDCAKENQSFGTLDVGARSIENGLFWASVTMPLLLFLLPLFFRPLRTPGVMRQQASRCFRNARFVIRASRGRP